MGSLSSDLLAVLDAFPASISHNVACEYRQKIGANADELNTVGQSCQDAHSINRAALACKASRLLFGGRAIVPDDSVYKETLRRCWSMTCWLPAQCIVKLENVVEVALALRIVTFLQATFAVRSGGHQPNPGFGSVGEAGILLDLGSLSAVNVSSDRAVASLQPGATWARVYEILEKQELNVVGGRIAEVGVGGLILGGGMSHFSNGWGLVCDHVKNIEIVLADSTVVQANAQEHSDLLRALKGGGPNFGIVTRYDLYTNPDYRLWYTLKVYSPADVDRVVKAAVTIEEAMEHDHRIGFFLTVKSEFLVAGMLYKGDAPSPKVFEAFDDVEPMTVAAPETNGTQFSFARVLSMAGECKWEVGTVAVRPDPKLYVELHEVLQNIKPPPSCSYGFTFQPIGGPAVQKGQERGGNCVDIPPENQSWLAITAQWTDAKDDNLARAGMHRLISDLAATASARGQLLSFQFMNDASYIQSPLKALGGETLDFLWDTSRKYDPASVFQKLQNGGFLLSKVGPR